MKPKILKLTTVVLLFLITEASCQKDEIEYADESIEISSYPWITIYKSKNDYVNYVDIQITEEGKINAVPSYSVKDPRISIDTNGNIKQNFRWRLKSGYILDMNVSLREAFTDITISEYVKYNTKNNVAVWPDSLILPRIIDMDPFLEFYHYDGIGKPERIFTIGEINEMIETGTLETVFTRLK